MGRWVLLLLLLGFVAGCRDEEDRQGQDLPAQAADQVARRAPGEGEMSPEDVTRLIAQLGSTKYSERVSAALRLGDSRAPEAPAALLVALQEECSLSNQDAQARHIEAPGLSPAVASGLLKRAYLMGLWGAGGHIADEVRASLGTAEQPFKSWLNILLGYFGERDQFQELVRLARESEDGFVRANAVRALGHLGMQEAVAVLREALEDPFVVEMDDVHLPLVRESARAALRQLGAGEQ